MFGFVFLRFCLFWGEKKQNKMENSTEKELKFPHNYTENKWNDKIC